MTAHTGDFERKIKKSRTSLYSLQKSVQQTQQRMQRLFVGAVSGYGAARLIKTLISAASAAEETRNKFEVVFKGQAEAAEKFADALGESVGRSKSTLMGFMAGLQDIFVPLGFARDRAFEMSRAITRLGIDIASFNDKADADVLLDLSSAMTGMHRTVRKYGIVILNTTLNQELMNMGIEKGISGATEMQKAQARLNIILGSSKDAQGDAARTAGTYANQLKRMKDNAHDLAITLGEKLLPAATKIVGSFIDVIDVAEASTSTKASALQEAKRSALLLAITNVASKTPLGFAINKLMGLDVMHAQNMAHYLNKMAEEKEAQRKALNAANKAVETLPEGSRKLISTEDAENLEKLFDLVEQTRFKVETFGMTDALKEWWTYAEKGASLVGEQKEDYDKWLDSLMDVQLQHEALTRAAEDRAEAEKEATRQLELQSSLLERQKLERESFAESVFQSTRTPLEVYNKTINKLGEILDAELIDWDTYTRATREARQTLEGPLDVGGSNLGGPRRGGAITFDPFLTPISDLIDRNVIDPQTEEQRKTNQLLMSQTNLLEIIARGGLN